MKTLLSLMMALMMAYAVPSNSTMAGDKKSGGLSVTNAWARATPKLAKSAAAYFMVSNTGATDDRLVAVKSKMAKKAQIHLSSMHDGVMKMEHVDGVAVPAGGKAELKPGAYHVMFMGLKGPFNEGETFPLTLVFEKAGEIKVSVTIMKAGAMGGMKMKHK